MERELDSKPGWQGLPERGPWNVHQLQLASGLYNLAARPCLWRCVKVHRWYNSLYNCTLSAAMKESRVAKNWWRHTIQRLLIGARQASVHSGPRISRFLNCGKDKSLHKSSQTSHFICTSCAHCHIALIRFLALTLVGCDRVKHRTYQRLETKTKRLKNDWNTIKKTSQSISKLSPRFFGPPEHREAARSLCKASILWRKLRSPRGYQHLPDAHDQRPLEATFPGSVKENGTIIVIISGFKCLIYLNWDKIADVAISSLSQRLLATNIRICNRLTGCAMRLVSEGMSWVYRGCGQLSFNQRLRIEPKRQVSSKQFSGGQYLFDTKGRHQNGHKFCEKKDKIFIDL